ncbi:ABC transporter substrate-binding protein [Saccharopolyspora sp. 6T]|uniref:ABC transporter substrate-binding protein n=1 Tax=Saccharopolyspora sp. 6T TaxID=2877238 RepID=UPI0027E126DC|nr:ABC transporter substrate-binding protein [Saccharopolyspora sp. 6T]
MAHRPDHEDAMLGFRRLPALLLTVLGLLFAGTACATRTPSPAPEAPVEDPAAAFPAKIALDGQEPITLPQQPKHIVSLSPTATESLYAIGAGDQVEAADRSSSFPADAPRTELNALSSDAAAVAGHDPDLVIAPDGAGKLVEGLRELEIPVLVTPAATSLDDAYAQIETLGQATGHSRQARDVTARMRADIAKIVADTPKAPEPLTYFHELSPDFYTATSRSFIGDVYGLFGLRNIADDAEGEYPQLAQERIVQADPDLIFLADSKCCGATADAVAARPGWDTLTAVRERRVVTLDEDVAGRWGPRVVDLVRAISDSVSRAQRP